MDVERVRAACTDTASAQVPPMFAQVVTRPGFRTPTRTTCDQQGTRSTCVTSGGDYVPPEIQVQDVNEERRSNLFTECMVRRGFHYRLWK